VRQAHVTPWGGPADSGVTGDPARATAEIGRRGLAFKVDAALAQYRSLR
jgi:creatinine amidohydrolase/Fe(II)-dependent formamide hydrolase-like protein